MSAGSPGEMSGFLDVKVPARVRRRRGLAPWKAWKKQWVTVRSNSDCGVQVLLGGSCVRVPPKSILCRSESRSRRMMSVNGGFPISFIDNAHSRVAGLTGLYGNLVVGPHRLTLHDPSSEQLLCSWKWQQLHQFHLAATEIKDDEHKICIIHTSSEFPAGAGQIHVFCPRAAELLDRLLTSGRVRRLLSSPLPSPPPLRRGARRLSRSESDLHCFASGECSPKQKHHFLRHKGVLERSHSSSRTSATSDEYVQAIGGKVASSLISAGLGLLFSTPACSEADTESLHEYQKVGSLDSDECDEELISGRLEPGDNSLPLRRESGISIASGIYEEIADGDAHNNTNHYENPATLHWGCLTEDKGDSPPPLPPRKQTHHFLDSSIHEAVGREWCYRTPPTWTPRLQRDPCRGPSVSCPTHRSAWGADTPPQPEPDYLPMSPSPARLVAEEQHYTVMASVNTT
ncbi:uncharacterized protein LOC110836411 [Zootermopsis nevadensis]|uniref:uncharacterized protein LOC110836411 n=1 Tax=Zootermopsis nevadensis TaxID=136037 RepID=UPI000B8E3A3C|nr:uncharacterized protein LOC110836411 [Zootermopsis nevadensis]